MAFIHETVLLHEAVRLLNPRAGRLMVDGTLGGGGHAEAMLETGATVLGIDRDRHAIESAGQRLLRFGDRFSSMQASFSEVETIIADRGMGRVDGILVDLGISSPQLDTAERGFSFQTEGPLDMRMGDQGATAADLIAETPESDLADLIFKLGDEPFSRRIARALKTALPKTTLQAADVVSKAVPRKAWPKKIHVATRTFQALRIAVNRELEELDRLLECLPRILNPGGVAAVISFHSLEDRRVKTAFRAFEGHCGCPPDFPQCVCGAKSTFRLLTRKPIGASEAELERNSRSRSAHLRAVEKLS